MALWSSQNEYMCVCLCLQSLSGVGGQFFFCRHQHRQSTFNVIAVGAKIAFSFSILSIFVTMANVGIFSSFSFVFLVRKSIFIHLFVCHRIAFLSIAFCHSFIAYFCSVCLSHVHHQAYEQDRER